MTLRQSPITASKAFAVPVRGLEWFNTRHPYSHNDYFHPWILKNLPQRRRRALDVGSGEGLLAARLAERFEHVDAADIDPAMRSATAERCAALPVALLDGFDCAEGEYDLITMVAALHHLPLRESLLRCRELLAPGGRLLVVGLARQTLEPADLIWELGSAVLNPVIGVIEHPRPHRGPRPQPPFPVAAPKETVTEIASAAAGLSGARVTRRIPFRYTLYWTKP
ncbi:Methyltransferase type 12 OS=Tsukamurella paurometabola (strain ATCC 8368 / DSM / CCUG 35730/ CIP 100753 / JCM 10117 / KCTC 9821 / NBRC 16120 / NCIMB 702349/ NCTC 13040) OX=521096 GN=Tpau_1502 PE=4 SV=1 [Tsukamurella paurometabola]|uniref:Methyltransferase type 12 n=1 Tax=Tsukamurella paurometabola (strain ATCC 8368 / DSM 20162 / CCUG 35730 / CIP 100753 / JCM 10117 / KCTC 9821 / NBRC 16120 / NCIMB 702349 / NCTC 13040) TaxID=521096 RepID=D5UXN4_TSUPD|nr:class I SAM-dependent methyltransferase [Tsukamurella paurometabola]ADG78126.1 Methyltransferase type 12 [Tsukamurella paurometabola DSM 20162]SUP30309.1 Ribosomal protein L11 methylase [Tsukamurella paurometabola]